MRTVMGLSRHLMMTSSVEISRDMRARTCDGSARNASSASPSGQVSVRLKQNFLIYTLHKPQLVFT